MGLIIEKLILKDFVTLGEKIHCFKNGINIVSGDNGTGKSTIVEALGLLLTNEYAENLEYQVNDFSVDAKAILEFNHNKEKYISSIYIVIKKGKPTTERELYKNGILLATGENVSKELKKILPPLITNYSLFYRQFGNRITDIKDSERRNCLAELHEIDFSKKVDEQIKPAIFKLEEDIKEVENKQYSPLKYKNYEYKTEKPLPIIADNVEFKISQLKENQRLYKEREKNIAKINDEKLYDKLKEAEEKLIQIKIDYSRESLEKNKQKQIENIELNYQSDKQENDEKSKILNNDLLEIIQQGKELKNKIDSIHVLEIINFNEELLQEARKKYTEFSTNHENIVNNINDLKNGICPLCGNSCINKHNEWIKEEEKLNESKNHWQLEINKLEMEQRNNNEAIKNNNIKKEQKQNLTIELKGLEPQYKSKKSHLKEIDSNASKINKEKLEKIEKVEKKFNEDIFAAKDIIDAKQSNVNNLKIQIGKLEMNEVENKQTELDVLEEQLKKYNSVVEYNNLIVNHNAQLKKDEDKDQCEIKKIETKLKKIKDDLSDYKSAKDIMLNIYPPYRLEQEVTMITEETNSFIEKIYYKPLYINFSANKSSMKMTFGCGRSLPSRKLSGAEKIITNVAVQNVFNKRQELDCIVMDEPDSALDNKHKQAFFENLSEMGNQYSQMIIISHSDEMKNYLLTKGANVIQL